MLLTLTNCWACCTLHVTFLQLLSCKFYKDIRYKDKYNELMNEQYFINVYLKNIILNSLSND